MKMDGDDKTALAIITFLIISMLIISFLLYKEYREDKKACEIFLKLVDTEEQIKAYTQVCK